MMFEDISAWEFVTDSDEWRPFLNWFLETSTYDHLTRVL